MKSLLSVSGDQSHRDSIVCDPLHETTGLYERQTWSISYFHESKTISLKTDVKDCESVMDVSFTGITTITCGVTRCSMTLLNRSRSPLKTPLTMTTTCR